MDTTNNFSEFHGYNEQVGNFFSEIDENNIFQDKKK